MNDPVPPSPFEKDPDLPPQEDTKRRWLEIILSVLLGLLLASGVAIWQIRSDEARRADLRQEAIRPPTASEPIGGPFTLINQDGETVKDTNYRGKYLIVYFGYTYCPDMCPTGLTVMARTMDLLGPDADKVQPLFITIDPTRDTPEKMKQYVASFHPRIVGLSGSPDQIATVAKAYKVYYAKGENVDNNDYMMDHSTAIYLMDPNGAFITTFAEDADPKSMADTLRGLLAGQKLDLASPSSK